MRAHHLAQGGDRLDLVAAQVERIEIKAQLCEQGGSRQNDGQSAPNDPPALIRQKAIDGRKEGVADFRRFPRRLQDHQRRWQHRDAGDERHYHANARDEAQLGHPAIDRG